MYAVALTVVVLHTSDCSLSDATACSSRTDSSSLQSLHLFAREAQVGAVFRLP